MNNEEKILALLEKHDAMLEKQNKMLEKHDAMLEKLIQTQDEHSDLLQRHSDSLAELQKIATKVAITQENIVLPRLNLLAEGHQTLMDTLAPKNRVEALEDDIAVLKVAVKSLSQEVAALKQAQ